MNTTMMQDLKTELEVINARIKALLAVDRTIEETTGTTIYQLMEIKEHILTGIIHLYETQASAAVAPKLKLAA